MIRFDHFNINVLDLDRSFEFYQKALDLKKVREFEPESKAFKIMFLGDEETNFKLELTWLRNRKEPYNLGECEYHLAFVTDCYDDFYRRHKEMGCICYENPEMGIYFITDPDGYWLEIVPNRD